MPRTRVRKPPEPSLPVPVPIVFVKVWVVAPIRVRPPGKGKRARHFDCPFAALRYAEDLAARLGIKTWIEGLPSPSGAARGPFHQEPDGDDDDD